ncbi:uncharacterized protein LOC126664241 [Mercurialis annua]|uniref:uncharacterized protein LOC126664241 n=1 Tax=Mercurialis annua TaxID=3986 RepID=UPI00215F5A2E|nr:uncharacterized protein LOC126664241 [Mercurialis annua]
MEDRCSSSMGKTSRSGLPQGRRSRLPWKTDLHEELGIFIAQFLLPKFAPNFLFRVICSLLLKLLCGARVCNTCIRFISPMDFPNPKAYKRAPLSTEKISYSQSLKEQNPPLHCLKLLVLLLLLMADPKRTNTSIPRKKKPTTKKISLTPVLEEDVDTQVISGQNFTSPRPIGPLVIREPDYNVVAQSQERHCYGKGKQKLFQEDGSQTQGGTLNGNHMFHMIDINAPLLVSRGEASSSRQQPTGNSPAFRSPTQKSPVSEMINQTVQLKITEPSLILHVKAESHSGGKRWMLALKVISKKIFSITTVKSDIQDKWKLRGEFAMAKHDMNMFSLRLSTQEDYDMVLEERPWCIHSQLVNVKEWPSDIPMSDVDFTTSPFWIQMKGLPPNQINEENGLLIAGLFHRFLELDMDPFAPLWRQQLLRLRAEVSVTDPFLAGFNNVVADGKKVWIKFRYEKLPDICFYCGMLGHNRNFCDTKNMEEQAGTAFVGKYRYGLFMRASPMVRARELAQVIEAKRRIQELQQELANNAGVFNTGLNGNQLEPFTDQEFVNTDLYMNADYFNNVTDFQIPQDPHVSNFLQASFSELTNMEPTDIHPLIHTRTTATHISEITPNPQKLLHQTTHQNMRLPKGILNQLTPQVQKKITGVADPRDIPMENQVELVVK